MSLWSQGRGINTKCTLCRLSAETLHSQLNSKIRERKKGDGERERISSIQRSKWLNSSLHYLCGRNTCSANPQIFLSFIYASKGRLWLTISTSIFFETPSLEMAWCYLDFLTWSHANITQARTHAHTHAPLSQQAIMSSTFPAARAWLKALCHFHHERVSTKD